MKGKLISQKNVTTKYEIKSMERQTNIPQSQVNVTEILARAWMVCDPNRQPANPDAPIDMGTMKGQPEWRWFVPRAEATIKFLEDNGFEVKRLTPEQRKQK